MTTRTSLTTTRTLSVSDKRPLVLGIQRHGAVQRSKSQPRPRPPAIHHQPPRRKSFPDNPTPSRLTALLLQVRPLTTKVDGAHTMNANFPEMEPLSPNGQKAFDDLIRQQQALSASTNRQQGLPSS
jgi:hypothetical protein